MINWLNTAFRGFDAGVFNFTHGLAKAAGGFLTPLFKVISLLGDKGMIFLLTAVILMLFVKTRKVGVCMLLAVACGAVITNIVLKNVVNRPRPFLANEDYKAFWEYVGSPFEDESSFPSGHTTAAMAAMTALFLTCNKKWSWVGFIGALVMGLDRVYLIVHYGSDVVAGFIAGAIGALAAFYLTKWVFCLANKYKEKKFFNFVLSFDVIEFFRKDKVCEKAVQENDVEQDVKDDN
ncbi:MAG: phosphatase PAP2 family protein [Clostridia bacterium]|nr:phosphatase PAP2 family protein [Clostridia bacterium]